MAGITRIKINSDWDDWRTRLSAAFAPIADGIYRKAFSDIGIQISEETEAVNVTKEEAAARYDWKEGIDLILTFSNGTRATFQEKFLTFWKDTATFEERKTSGEDGAWYYCTAQYYFVGYARQYWDYRTRKVVDDPVMDFQNWILIDLPGLHRIDAARKLNWEIDQNHEDGRRATFRYLLFDDVPKECVVTRYKHIRVAHDPTWPVDTHPTWPRETYEQWLRQGAGTKEQQERYREAIEWYNKQ